MEEEARAATTAPTDPGLAPPAGARRLSLLQMLYDDVFLMLLLGLIVPLVCYTIWGFLELMSVPLSG
jgi:hypothetical protein